jgi:regulator of sigma E protease
MSPAEQAGILPGDFISSVNGIEIFNFAQLQDIISESENRQIKLDVIRNGGVLSFLLEKKYLVTQDKNGNLEELLRIGISGTILLKPQIVSRPLLGGIFESFRAVIYVVRLTLSSISNIITNKIGVEQISGPVGITYVIGETTKFGLIPTLGLIGMISASIGVLNLLPIPMLDGGHLLSYLLEIILGRRIVNKLNKPMTVLGFAIIATLFSIGFLNDIDKIFL